MLYVDSQPPFVYFNPKPNYVRIKKYYDWPGTPEQMQVANPEGFLIEIEWLQSEDVLKIEEGFRAILRKYDLSNFYDDLLVLLISKYKDINNAITEIECDYKHRIRVKELADFLLISQSINQNKDVRLTISSNNTRSGITDEKTILWLSKTLIEAIEKGSYRSMDFGLAIDDMMIDKSNGTYNFSIEKLKRASSAIIDSPKKFIKAQKADLCLYVYKYLIAETHIKPDPDSWFSDKLLNFYFDVLELLEYTHRLSIESEPKDYTRSLLWNRLKQLNPSLSRK